MASLVLLCSLFETFLRHFNFLGLSTALLIPLTQLQGTAFSGAFCLASYAFWNLNASVYDPTTLEMCMLEKPASCW